MYNSAAERSLHPIEPGTTDHLPSHPKRKMAEPQTAVFAFVGAHQSDVLMDGMEAHFHYIAYITIILLYYCTVCR